MDDDSVKLLPDLLPIFCSTNETQTEQRGPYNEFSFFVTKSIGEDLTTTTKKIGQQETDANNAENSVLCQIHEHTETASPSSSLMSILQIARPSTGSRAEQESVWHTINSAMETACHATNKAHAVSLKNNTDPSSYSHVQQSLPFLEELERRTIEELWTRVEESLEFQFVSLKYELGKKSDRNGDQQKAEPDTDMFSDQYAEKILDNYMNRVFSYIDIHFHEIFPEGIEGTALTEKDVYGMVNMSLCLPILADGDMTGCRTPFTSSAKITVDNQPPDCLGCYFAIMSCKASISAAKSVTSVEEWRKKINKFFYHPHESMRTEIREVRLALESIRYSQAIYCMDDQEVDKNIPRTFAAKVEVDEPTRHSIYTHCLEVERRYNQALQRTASCNTITVEFQRGEIIGKGANGIVYRCTNVENGQFLALKEIPLRGGMDDDRSNIRFEINTLKGLSHRNIVKYYGYRFDEESKKVSVLMEYLPKNLREVAVNSRGGLTPALIATYGRQILRGLAHLHERKLIHRDIKAANVLVSETGEVKLSDFGTAMGSRPPEATLRNEIGGNDSSNAAVDVAGTPLYLAPELLHGVLPSEASDMWAFGCLVIELLTGKYPWQELLSDTSSTQLPPLHTLLFHIRNTSKPPQIPAELRQSLPQSLVGVVDSALQLDANDRPSAKKLLELPFFNSPHQRTSETDRLGASTTTDSSSNTQTPKEASSFDTQASSPPHHQRGTFTQTKSNTEVVGLAMGRCGSAENCDKATVSGGVSTLVTQTMILEVEGRIDPME